MGHNHTIPARRMETPAAMVGALLLALIALGRTSALASPSRYKPRADHLPTHFFPSFFPHFFLQLCVTCALFWSRTFLVCSGLPISSKPILPTLGSFCLLPLTNVFALTPVSRRTAILPFRHSRSSFLMASQLRTLAILLQHALLWVVYQFN